MAINIKNLKIVEVTWHDSCSDGGWKSLKSSLSGSISTCQSVGYLLQRNRKQVILIQSRSDTGNLSDQIAIPRTDVVKIIYLKESGV